MAGAGPTSASKKLITSISKRLETLSAESVDYRIWAVPDKLRRTHKEAFSPKQVSIGPFYHHGKQLKAMEQQKWRCLNIFLDQAKKSLEECVELIKNLEHKIRQCYLERIDLNYDEFITMVLVDGAFIIELFLLHHSPERREENDIIFDEKRPWIITNVRRDLSLMENQLPFFVLEELFDLRCENHSGVFPSLLDLAYDFLCSRENLKTDRERISGSNVRHLLDALRLWYLPATQKALDDGWKKIQEIPRASQLRAAGVKFRMGKSNCLTKIQFSNGVLYIPCLKLLPPTESFLRNVTAFEKSCYKHDSYFIDYVAFMGNLIHTRADAKLLISKGIINTDDWLGRDETLAKNEEALAKFFNNLGKESGVWTRNMDFCSVRQNLKPYYRSPWHKLKLSMKRNSVFKKKP